MKSSTMKGASSPCQSTAAETEPDRERPVRMGRGQLLYSRPRNQRAKGAGNYAEAGASGIPEQPGRDRPANVTAVVNNITNRARSVAAGVVSGAGPVNRCSKSRTLMRVPQVGPGSAWTQSPSAQNGGLGVAAARQLQRRVRAHGWCRAQKHTRKR